MQKNLMRFLRAVGKRLGTPDLKKKIWNFENEQYQEYLHDYGIGYRSLIADWIEKYAKGGNILDLGCSDGHVGFSLNPSCYSIFVGVDLSSVAIARANRKWEQAGKSDRSRFIVHDIFTYQPDRMFDVVLFKDAIYYASNRVILKCLNRLADNLANQGVFIVHMDDVIRHTRIKELAHANFRMIEENSVLDSNGVLMIFR